MKSSKATKSIKQLKKKLWRLVSLFVRRKARGVCYTCFTKNHWKKMHAGHFIEKSLCNPVLYFYLRNVKCQCARCNLYLSGNKDCYARELIKEYGAGVIDQLFTLKGKVIKWTTEDYLAQIDYYENKLKELSK